MGQLAGGKGPLAIYQTNWTGYPPQRAEPLSGGAQNYTGGTDGGQVSGGDGGFGGGGGQARSPNSPTAARGGDGGEGIVVIQYIL